MLTESDKGQFPAVGKPYDPTDDESSETLDDRGQSNAYETH